MPRKRRRRRGNRVKAFALLSIGIIGIVGGISGIVWGANQLLQPGEKELPTVIGTVPQEEAAVAPQEVIEDEKCVEAVEAEYTVVIDPGHGGGDGGTVGHIVEKDMTHAVAAQLYTLLQEDGRFIPVLTHSLDMEDDAFMSQGERVDVAQEAQADLFLSIHGNAYDGESVRGTECFPIPPGRDAHEESLVFAQLIASGFQEEGAVLRGETGVRYAYFRGSVLHYAEEEDTDYNSAPTYEVLQNVKYPAVVVEQCYISSLEDLAIFGEEEGYNMAAQVYYNAICQYFYE